jgi:hypothetical protein
MMVRFSFHDYRTAFRAGITLITGSVFVPFLLVGIGGFFFDKRLRSVAAVTLGYALLHFLVLPNWQERWFGAFYPAMTVTAAEALQVRAGPQSPVGSDVRSAHPAGASGLR